MSDCDTDNPDHNVENAIAITPDSVFEIGSMTKQFTAMAITLLADAGRLATGMLARQRGTNFPSGESHAYGNSGYVLLALVVERVSA